MVADGDARVNERRRLRRTVGGDWAMIGLGRAARDVDLPPRRFPDGRRRSAAKAGRGGRSRCASRPGTRDARSADRPGRRPALLPAHGGDRAWSTRCSCVDDGSTDDTAGAADRRRRPGGRAARAGAGGKGQAMAAALAAAGRRRPRVPRRRRGEHDPGTSSPGCSGPLLVDRRRRPRQGLLRAAAARRADRRRPGHRAGGPPGASSCCSPSCPGCASRWPARRPRTAGCSRRSGFAPGYGVELGLLIDVAAALRGRPRSPRSTWACGSTATGPCTSCGPRPSTCCAPRSSARPDRR